MFSQAILFLLPASLVLALEKVTVFGFPVYFLEALFLVFLGLSVWKVTKESLRVRWQGFDRWIALGGILFVAGAIMSILYQSQSVSLTSLGQLKSWFLFPLVFALTLYSLQRGEYKERMLIYGSWLVGVIIVAFTALYGYSHHILTYDGRLAFPYNSPNFLALLVAPGILLAIFFLFQANTWCKRAFFLSTATLLLIPLYLTHSYNTWLALILAVLASLLLLWIQKTESESRQKLGIFVAVVVLALGILLFLEHDSSKWQDLFLEDSRSSLDSRVMIWQSSWAILQDHWFLGIGVGNFQREYLAYQPHFTPYLEWAVPQPHNLLLAVWLQTGSLGLLGFILILGRLVVRLFESTQRKNQNEGGLLLALWFVFLCYGLIDTPYFRNDLAFLFWLQVLLTLWYIEED